MTDAGNVYTTENFDTFTSSGTSEQKFEDDTKQTVSGTNVKKEKRKKEKKMKKNDVETI